MSIFNLEDSLRRAEDRLRDDSSRRRRSDRGHTRLDPAVLERLRDLLLVQERPSMKDVAQELNVFCRDRGTKAPSRATLYNALTWLEPHRYLVRDLPRSVREALVNLDDDTLVPGPQLAFACFQDGDTGAVSYASGLPWLDLHQAASMRGWRERSRGLLHAVSQVRGI